MMRRDHPLAVAEGSGNLHRAIALNTLARRRAARVKQLHFPTALVFHDALAALYTVAHSSDGEIPDAAALADAEIVLRHARSVLMRRQRQLQYAMTVLAASELWLHAKAEEARRLLDTAADACDSPALEDANLEAVLRHLERLLVKTNEAISRTYTKSCTQLPNTCAQLGKGN